MMMISCGVYSRKHRHMIYYLAGIVVPAGPVRGVRRETTTAFRLVAQRAAKTLAKSKPQAAEDEFVFSPLCQDSEAAAKIFR